jgi:MoxR-like ATPase
MQEKQVTIAEQTYKLALPFLVLATQNPIENEGAYALPEAQLDRFMMKVLVGYNTKEEELEIARRVANNKFEPINKVVDTSMLELAINEMMNIHIDKEVEEYIVDIVMATREPKKYGIDDLDGFIEFGASPRASIDLYKASRAVAYLRGESFVSPIDVAYIANEVLRHRIIISYEAEAKDITPDIIVDKIVSTLPIP